MTKPYGMKQTEVGDMACLAVEQFNYLEALFSVMAEQLTTFGTEDRIIKDAKRLALLGRSHAEQSACAFLDYTNA